MAEWKTPFKQGVSNFRAGKHEDAIASFSEVSSPFVICLSPPVNSIYQALRLGGDTATVCDARAAVYQKQGKLKEALKDAKAVIDSQPGRWQVSAPANPFQHRLIFHTRDMPVLLVSSITSESSMPPRAWSTLPSSAFLQNRPPGETRCSYFNETSNLLANKL